MDSPPLTALGLVRVSTADQAESGFSLPDQEAAIRHYCQRRGYRLAAVLADDGVSGRILERPAVRQALTLAETGGLGALVLVKLDRLGRENRVIQELLYRFRSLGVRVEFVEHGAGDTPADRLLLNVLGGVSEFELEQIRQRTMSGRRRKAESGRMPLAFNLLGYALVRRWEEEAGLGESGRLRVVEPEAELVRELFRRYSEGESLSALVKWLNGSGHRTRRGNEWRVTTLRVTLENPAYIGEARYGWREVTSYTDHERKRLRVQRQEEWVTVPCPPLVARDVWERAQARLQSTAERFTGRPSNVWPLRGCVECETCRGKLGRPLKACGERKSTNPRREGYYVRTYRCPGCNAGLDADKWERKARAWLLAQVEPGAQVAAVAERVRRLAQAADGWEAQVERHQAELRALDADERRLLEAAMHFSPHLVAEKAAALRQRREESARALQALLAAQAQYADPERLAQEAEAKAARLRELLEQGTPEDLSAAFRRHLTIILRKRRAPRFVLSL